jgi:hypothetical protein
MRKKLNSDAIANELAGGSAFFPNYEGDASPAPQGRVVADLTRVAEELDHPNDRTGARSNARTPVRSLGKRIITRNSFEVYEDQMEALRRLAFREKMDGKVGSMSAMVRGAIDAFLKEQPSET